MNFKDILKSFLIHTCIYTVVAFSAAMLFCLIGKMTSFAVVSYFLILAFCAFFALANVLFAKLKISVWWRTLIHAVLTLGGFYLCIYTRYADIGTSNDKLVLFVVLITLLYAVCFGIFLAIRYARLRKTEQKQYQRVFGTNANHDQKRR